MENEGEYKFTVSLHKKKRTDKETKEVYLGPSAPLKKSLKQNENNVEENINQSLLGGLHFCECRDLFS